jgi:O-antigen ligase
MFFFLFYQLVNTTARLRNLLFLYCLGIGVYAFYILKSGSFGDDRIAFGSMFDPNDLAFFVISFLTFNLLFITKENAGYKRITAVINIILGFIVILKTGSRGGLIALISVAAYLMFAKTVTVKLSFMKKVVLVIVAIASLQFVNLNSKRYETLFDMKEDYNVTEEEGRLAIWEIGMKIMLSRPLTGVGMNMFGAGVGLNRVERGVLPKWQTAHNSIVQIGAETGIFGLILFCLMSSNVITITGQIIGKSQSEELVKISEMAKAGFLGSFISAMFLSQAYSVYWALYIVISAVLIRLIGNEQPNNKLLLL